MTTPLEEPGAAEGRGKLQKLRVFHRQVRAAAAHYRGSPAVAWARAAWLLGHGFSPKEILFLGLLDPSLPFADLKQYVSKEHFLRFQAQISPRERAVLLEDKATFYTLCAQFSVPTPQVIACVTRTGVRLPDGGFSDGPAALDAALEGLDGAGLIAKPSGGVYGRGLQALTVRDGHLVVEGRPLSAAAFLGGLSPGVEHVVQLRAANHPEITRLTGMETLQTLRMVTVLPPEPAERAQLATASWRVVGAPSLSDNFDFGRGGNMRARVDLDSGTVTRVVRASPSGFGIEDLTHHPRTGLALLGAHLPFWSEVRDLVERKAACFWPIRLVGWDVAITPEGPVFLEGNFWFDPADNVFGSVRGFVERVQCGGRVEHRPPPMEPEGVAP